MASLRPWPVMVLTPVLGEAATTSWPPWRRMGAVFEPIRPVPPMTTIFMFRVLSSMGSECSLRHRQPCARLFGRIQNSGSTRENDRKKNGAYTVLGTAHDYRWRRLPRTGVVAHP